MGQLGATAKLAASPGRGQSNLGTLHKTKFVCKMRKSQSKKRIEIPTKNRKKKERRYRIVVEVDDRLELSHADFADLCLTNLANLP